MRSRDDVIQASEDEDTDFISSDDDLPSLFSKPSGAKAVPVPARKENNNLFATPEAKRTALAMFSSPLTIMPKHKFDIQALLKHAEADKALEESERRIASIMADEDDAMQGHQLPQQQPANNQKKVPVSLHDTIMDVLSDAEGSQDEGHRERLLRAVKRTEAAVHRKEWHFFDRRLPNTASIEARNPFPSAAARGAWAFLAPAKGRAELFEDGLPYHIQAKMQSLPDDIFLWVLDEAPLTKTRKLRGEYLRLLGVCPDHVRRLVDGQVISQLFRSAGASERSLSSSPQTSRGSAGHQRDSSTTAQRDWAPLRTVLLLSAEISQGLTIQPLTRSVAIMLRLGMDSLVREDLAIEKEFQDALFALVGAVSRDDWDSFCGDVCMSLYSLVDDASLRWDSVSSIPSMGARLIDLRRRLAIVFVFDDPQRARARPEDNFSMRAVIDRLEADEFIVDRHLTDYYELAALVELLSVATADGCAPVGGGPEAVKQYNSEVDEVMRRIKIMWSSIHEQGAAFTSRLDARVNLKDFQRKLEHAVRTRPPPRTNIFDIDPREEKESQRPIQQHFLQKFLDKGRPPKTP